MRLFFSLGEQFSKACVGIKEKIIPYFVKISLVGADIALRGRFFDAKREIFSFRIAVAPVLMGGKREESKKKTGSSLLQPCRLVPTGRKERRKQEKNRKFSFAAVPSGAGGAERERKARKGPEVLFCRLTCRCQRGGKGEEARKRAEILFWNHNRHGNLQRPFLQAPPKVGENISHVPILPRLLRTRRKASCPGPLSSPSRPCRPSGHRCRGRSPRFRRRKAGCRPGRTGPRGSS